MRVQPSCDSWCLAAVRVGEQTTELPDECRSVSCPSRAAAAATPAPTLHYSLAFASTYSDTAQHLNHNDYNANVAATAPSFPEKLPFQFTYTLQMDSGKGKDGRREEKGRGNVTEEGKAKKRRRTEKRQGRGREGKKRRKKPLDSTDPDYSLVQSLSMSCQ